MRTLIDRMEREDGVAMVIAVMLSGVIATLAILMLTVGTHTDKATTRGRNYVQSLHVAEAGVEQALARIEASGGTLTSSTFSDSTELGDYDVTITKTGVQTYVVESVGGVRRGLVLGAERSIRVTLEPPLSFDKALFSYTTVETKNNDIIQGDVWANHNVILQSGTIVTGSIVGATGYVSLQNGADVDGDVTSGGFHAADRYAVLAKTGVTIGGDITSRVVPVQCVGADNADYKVQLDNGSATAGGVTTWGSIQGSGTVGGPISTTECLPALATRPLPTFSYDPDNYDAATLHEFGQPGAPSATAVSDFQAYVDGVGKNIEGTFYVNQSGTVNQTTRVDLTGVTITGNTTIVTNTPVFANGTEDDGTEAIFALISTYQPPTGTACDVNHDSSECSIHLKNKFTVGGTTAVLIYSPYGPTAVKNSASQSGAIYADSIQVKNNQTLTYDERVDRVIGFGDVTYEVVKWEELSS